VFETHSSNARLVQVQYENDFSHSSWYKSAVFGSRLFSKRTLYTAHFVFLFRDSVPNELIQVNPLGLTITYFREDEAFR
jgi:type IV secretory pathway component VirB8